MYEIQTPILAKSAALAMNAAEAVMTGALEPKLANAAISGCRAVQGAVRVDVIARLAAPKIAFLEAAKIETPPDTKATIHAQPEIKAIQEGRASDEVTRQKR